MKENICLECVFYGGTGCAYGKDYNDGTRYVVECSRFELRAEIKEEEKPLNKGQKINILIDNYAKYTLKIEPGTLSERCRITISNSTGFAFYVYREAVKGLFQAIKNEASRWRNNGKK